MGHRALCNSLLAQKIQPTDVAAVVNLVPNDGPMIAPFLSGGRRSSVHNNAENSGMLCNVLNFNCSLDDLGRSLPTFSPDGAPYESNFDHVGPSSHSTRVILLEKNYG
jgi:hypothetical protein